MKLQLLIWNKDTSYRALGLAPGMFVRLWQGHSNADGSVPHKEDRVDSLGTCFESFSNEPEAYNGSTVYRVRDDGSLMTVKNNDDTRGH